MGEQWEPGVTQQVLDHWWSAVVVGHGASHGATAALELWSAAVASLWVGDRGRLRWH